MKLQHIAETMQALADPDAVCDPDGSHRRADALLCAAITELVDNDDVQQLSPADKIACAVIMSAFDRMEKWYT